MPDGSLDVCGRERQMARRTRERYAEIRQRLDAGQPEAAIRRATGLDRRTVQKYARAASADELVAGMSRESRLDEFKPYICQRWNQGLTDASQIHAELRQRGWTGSPQTVRRYVHLLRQAGLALPCHSGAMEGNVNKIKMIKRQMYGRAGFALLRTSHLAPCVTRTTKFAEEPPIVTTVVATLFRTSTTAS